MKDGGNRKNDLGKWPRVRDLLRGCDRLFDLAGCSSKTDEVKSGKSDGERPKAAGVQNPPTRNWSQRSRRCAANWSGRSRLWFSNCSASPGKALTAACLTPAFYNSDYAVPLVLDDGSEKREVAIPHDTAAVAGFGGNAAAATAKIAKTYWKKAPACLSSRPTSRRLWIVPSAASSRPRSSCSRTKPRSPPWA